MRPEADTNFWYSLTKPSLPLVDLSFYPPIGQ